MGSGGKQLEGRVTERGHYRWVVLISACWYIQGCDRTWYLHSRRYGQINLMVMEKLKSKENTWRKLRETRQVGANAFMGC